jgi:hypothetical protein
LIKARRNNLYALLCAVTAPFAGFGVWEIIRNGIADAGVMLLGMLFVYFLPYSLVTLGIRQNAGWLKHLQKRLLAMEAGQEYMK